LDEEDDDPQEWSDIFVDPLFSYAKIPAYNFISEADCQKWFMATKGTKE
jgi:hypothetical protein